MLRGRPASVSELVRENGRAHAVKESLLPHLLPRILLERPLLIDPHDRGDCEREGEDADPDEVSRVERRRAGGGCGGRGRFGMAGRGSEGRDDDAAGDEEDGEDLESAVASALEEILRDHGELRTAKDIRQRVFESRRNEGYAQPVRLIERLCGVRQEPADARSISEARLSSARMESSR